jgi:hypothetical protein
LRIAGVDSQYEPLRRIAARVFQIF